MIKIQSEWKLPRKRYVCTHQPTSTIHNIDHDLYFHLGLQAVLLGKLLEQVLNRRKQRQYDAESLALSAKLLELSPEVYTVWNYRREAIEPVLAQGGTYIFPWYLFIFLNMLLALPFILIFTLYGDIVSRRWCYRSSKQRTRSHPESLDAKPQIIFHVASPEMDCGNRILFIDERTGSGGNAAECWWT